MERRSLIYKYNDRRVLELIALCPAGTFYVIWVRKCGDEYILKGA